MQPTWMRLIIVLALVLALLASVGRARTASAHAELFQSDPPAQAVLARPPERIQLSFTEAVEPRSIEVAVLNAARERVDREDAFLAPGTTDAVTLTLKPGLPDGLYTVQWKVTSAVDGHTTRGFHTFTVGEQLSIPEGVIGAGTSASSGGVLGVAARWLTVLATVTLTGSFLFVPLMLAPGLRLLGAQAMASGPGSRDESASVTPEAVHRVAITALNRLLRICGGALIVAVAGVLLLLVVETDLTTPGGLADAFGRPLLDWIGETQRGTQWLARAGMLALIGIELIFLTREARAHGRAVAEKSLPWLLLGGLGAGTLLVQSLGSHSAALRDQRGLATAIDLIHLLAVAIWVGGLVQFGLAVLPALGPLGGPPRTRLLATLVPRFSLIAGTSVTVLVLSGIYQTVRLLGGWDQLTGGGWGRSLLIKLGLFGVLLCLAAFNLLIVSPRLKKLAGQVDRAAREAAAAVRAQFRRALLAEVGVAAIILLAAGALISNAPGEVEGFTPEGPFRPFILQAEAEGLTGRLVLSPGRIGLNRFDLTVATAANQPPPNGTEVVLRISTLDQDTGVNEARMEAVGGGRFTTTGSYLSTIGLWEVAALVRRPGADEARLAFQLSLTNLTGQAEVRENRPAAPIERGRELYANNCVNCHGAAGKGDGPLAPSLQPRPVDLTVHVPLHTDREIFNWIANGIPRTAMPAWKDAFTEEEIQAIINYLRQLAEQSNQQR